MFATDDNKTKSSEFAGAKERAVPKAEKTMKVIRTYPTKVVFSLSSKVWRHEVQFCIDYWRPSESFFSFRETLMQGPTF